jgi:hypothetical protein
MHMMIDDDAGCELAPKVKTGKMVNTIFTNHKTDQL